MTRILDTGDSRFGRRHRHLLVIIVVVVLLGCIYFKSSVTNSTGDRFVQKGSNTQKHCKDTKNREK